jgi:hypothetical protein
MKRSMLLLLLIFSGLQSELRTPAVSDAIGNTDEVCDATGDAQRKKPG